jgi:hypothetical protein
MSRYRFELATPADDADLRRVLAETPMDGRITVSFRREPGYFDAAVVDGRFRQVIAARDGETGRIIGFGSRSIAERYVNGRPESIGYLSTLRLLTAYRNRGLVARGYAFFRKMHGDGRTPLYLTTIAEGNEVALAVLISGRAGLPAYHFAGRYHTVAIPLARHQPSRSRPFAGEVRPAREEDLPAVLDFLASAGPRRQFFPRYRADDFFTPGGTFRDLRAEDLLLVYQGGRLVGTLAGWDQHGFRQTVVQGYRRPLGWVRPVYNVWARLRGLPILPGPGEAFRHLTAALPVTQDDDPAAFRALLEALLEKGAAGPCQYLLLGLHEADPLLAVARAYRAVWYTTRLYLVCWEDGEDLRAKLDGRPPYLELGSL